MFTVFQGAVLIYRKNELTRSTLNYKNLLYFSTLEYQQLQNEVFTQILGRLAELN